jgi:hypothetical protein
MGVTGCLYIVPAREFVPRANGVIEPQLSVENAHYEGTSYDIEYAWAEFHDVLHDFPFPLNHSIEGDICPDVALHDEWKSEESVWLGFVSPALVRKIARALDRIKPEEMMELLATRGVINGGDVLRQRYYSERYERLRAAYRKAAEAKAGLGVLLVG